MIAKIRKIIEEVIGSDKTLRPPPRRGRQAPFDKALGKQGKKFLVMASEKPEFGHYSTNAAFMIGEDPNKIAKEILRQAQEIYGNDLFEKVEVNGKFINFWISKSALIEELTAVLKTKPYWLNPKPSKINLEFISANPTGPLTMANGRGGFLGDVLANVLENVGMKVTREYYINDAGNQIKLLGESLLLSYRKVPLGEEHYKGGYIQELAEKLKGKIEKLKDLNAEEAGRIAAEELLKQIQQSLRNVGIKFDVWFSEYKNLHKKKELKKVLELLEKNGLVSEHDGAKWLKSSEIADEKDRVLVKSDGQPTYFLSDLAYHYDKFIKRKFDKAIDIWGADHHGYVARLKAGVKAIGVDPEKLKIIITQFVLLVEGGKEVKMSKRTGEFVTLDELIKEVGKDAARFFFLMHSPDTHMDFDLALAKERSVKNPVYYVQYAYVRCSSILRKLKVKSLKFKVSDFEELKSESELNLLRELIKLPDVISQTAEDYQVNRLARYAMEFAKAVHNFYEKERVINEKGEVSEPRLALVAATREVLAKLFKILGIEAPEKM